MEEVAVGLIMVLGMEVEVTVGLRMDGGAGWLLDDIWGGNTDAITFISEAEENDAVVGGIDVGTEFGTPGTLGGNTVPTPPITIGDGTDDVITDGCWGIVFNTFELLVIDGGAVDNTTPMGVLVVRWAGVVPLDGKVLDVGDGVGEVATIEAVEEGTDLMGMAIRCGGTEGAALDCEVL
jgi:hypothetical protein